MGKNVLSIREVNQDIARLEEKKELNDFEQEELEELRKYRRLYYENWVAIGSDGREAFLFWQRLSGQRNYYGEIIHTEIWNTLKHYGIDDAEELIDLFETICLIDDLYRELHGENKNQSNVHSAEQEDNSRESAW